MLQYHRDRLGALVRVRLSCPGGVAVRLGIRARLFVLIGIHYWVADRNVLFLITYFGRRKTMKSVSSYPGPLVFFCSLDKKNGYSSLFG